MNLKIVPKVLVKGLENLKIRGSVDSIQTTILLTSAWILRIFLETQGDLYLLKLQWEIINARWWGKFSQEKINNRMTKRLCSTGREKYYQIVYAQTYFLTAAKAEPWRPVKLKRKSITSDIIEVKIHRVIFQGNMLSPLLFVIVLIALSYILRKFN